jgi:L-ascorbate metabolism protein UlaG (beta-lactamase superfamily)
MGTILEWGYATSVPRFRLWISGDTLVHETLHEIPQSFPDIPLALLHLGGTRVLGVLLTLDAEQGVRALRIVQPRHVVPIHYDDYTVFRSPLADFLAAAQRASLDTTIHVLERGDRLVFAPTWTAERRVEDVAVDLR